MRAVLLLLASLLISSCASVNVTPPEKSDYEVSRTYALSFEDTWAHAVDWFAEQNVTVDLLEKPSGLITAKYHINDADNVADCGSIKVSGTYYKGTMVKNAALNVTIRSLAEEKTRENIYFFSDYDFQVQRSGTIDLLPKKGSVYLPVS